MEHVNKKIRLANGLPLRTSDDDNSSSGCSSSGALRHVIITPPRESSSISSRHFSFEDSQQRQQPRMLSSRNSFSPYNIRPLVIRSKRKIVEGTNLNVTSTAQKIINTLNSFSTPVVNAVKVPFDTKNFRPVSTPIRRDNQGPPIMKSPLVPAPEGRIYYNPAMNIHIPKFVEFGTNTDLTMSTFSEEHLDDFNLNSKGGYGGGKIKSTFTTRVHSAPLRHTLPSIPLQSFDLSPKTIVTPPVNLDKCKFKFSTPWSPSKVEEFVSKRKSRSSIESKNENSKQSPKRQWVCSKCQLTHEENVKICPCVNKMEKSPKSVNITGIPLKATISSSTKWDCPTCMVPNKSQDLKCVCCGEKNPKPPISSPVTAVVESKKWDCPTCMVPNKPQDSKCVCCGEKNPNGQVANEAKTTATTTATPSSTFSFGIKSSASSDTNTSKPSTASTFTFGTAVSSSSSSTTPAKSFTFGVKADTTVSTTTTSNTSSTTITSSANPFIFGTNNKSNISDSPKLPVKQSPKQTPYGTPESSSTTANKTIVPFGTSVKSLESTPNPSPSATIPTSLEQSLVSRPTPSNPFGSFVFGATSTTSALPGVIKDDNEFWQCDKCPARTRVTTNRCIGCDSKRPTEENKSNAVSSSAPKKSFHFEPFFGGPIKESFSSQTSTSTDIELKRKQPSSFSSSPSSFMYTPPSEPTLKMKAIEPVAPLASQPSEMKTGSFLDALAQGSQFTFSSSPGASLIPSGGIGTTAGATSTTAASLTTGGPPSGLFQFGAPANSAVVLNSNSTMSLTGNNNGLKQTTFEFGGGGLKNGPSVAPSSIFGSSTGGVAAPSPVFGSSNPAAPTPQFSMTPNINFMPTASTPSTGGFVFNAQSSGLPAGDGGLGQRKIRKAARRMR